MAKVYDLISCNSGLYPDILDLCNNGTHPLEGAYVYINQAYNGNPINTSQVYRLVLGGTDVDICMDWLPKLEPSTEQTCTPTYGIFKYKNCESNVYKNFGFPSGDPVNNVFRKDGDCDCWHFEGEESVADELVTAYTEYDDCTACFEARALELCSIGERALSYAVRITLPPPPPPDKGFKECCYTQIVLADLTDINPYKNDYTGVYFKRPTPNSTVDFFLVDAANNDYALNDSTYGTFQDFGGVQSDLSFYIVEWRKVLNLLLEGTYHIRQDVSIAGVLISYTSNTFTLKEFTVERADKTARIDCVMNGILVDENVNFKGTNFKTSLRFRGFFGNNQPEAEQDNVFRRDYYTEQVSLNINNKYILQGHSLPECITSEIFSFIIKGNDIFCSDYNIVNHSYKYEVLPVELDNIDGIKYHQFSRNANFNLVFTDRYKNKRKING